MQGGTLNAEEDDFNTAFSYFFEAYGGYADLDEPVEGERSVKYVMEGRTLNRFIRCGSLLEYTRVLHIHLQH